MVILTVLISGSEKCIFYFKCRQRQILCLVKQTILIFLCDSIRISSQKRCQLSPFKQCFTNILGYGYEYVQRLSAASFFISMQCFTIIFWYRFRYRFRYRYRYRYWEYRNRKNKILILGYRNRKSKFFTKFRYWQF